MLTLEIDSATQYATAYRDGKPVATLQRRRVYESGPVWKAFATDGTLIYISSYARSAKYLAREVEKALARGASIIE